MAFFYILPQAHNDNQLKMSRTQQPVHTSDVPGGASVRHGLRVHDRASSVVHDDHAFLHPRDPLLVEHASAQKAASGRLMGTKADGGSFENLCLTLFSR